MSNDLIISDLTPVGELPVTPPEPLATPCLSFAEMKSRVRRITRDDAGSFVDDDDISDWLNEAQMDLATRLEILVKTVTGTTSAVTVGLPPNSVTQEQVINILNMRLGTADDVEFVDDDTFYAYQTETFNVPHTIGRESGGTVFLYPEPTVGTTVTLTYEYLPGPLATDEAVSPLPCHMHIKLVRYAQAQAYYKLDELGRGDRALANYEQGLPMVDLGKDRHQPGLLVFDYMPGAFDMDPGAQHL